MITDAEKSWSCLKFDSESPIDTMEAPIGNWKEVVPLRISNEQTQQILAAQGVKASKAAKGTEAVQPTGGTDAVSVSSMGQEIQKALQAMSGIPEVRADRVAELKAQIDSGNYNVSGRDIADSMLRRAADKLL